MKCWKSNSACVLMMIVKVVLKFYTWKRVDKGDDLGNVNNGGSKITRRGVEEAGTFERVEVVK